MKERKYPVLNIGEDIVSSTVKWNFGKEDEIGSMIDLYMLNTEQHGKLKGCHLR
jgi:hypothetical protein